MDSISARNQLPGIVKSVSRGIVNADIIISMKSGLEISSVITLGSCMRMNLEPGDKVSAIIKASDVMLATGDNFAISSRNTIPGTITSIISGKVNDEIIIDAAGTELVCTITEASVKRLGLAAGTKVSAIVKASNVLILK